MHAVAECALENALMHVRQIGEMSDKRFAGITIIDYCRGLFSNLRQSGGSREL